MTSTSTMRSNNRATMGTMGGYAIETSFCGARPIAMPSAYDLQHAGQQSGTPSEERPESAKRRSEESLTGSEDLSAERNLIEEINSRTQQFPLTKQVNPGQYEISGLGLSCVFTFQDSYATAIYSSATRAQQARRSAVRKQSSYEQAMESGAVNQAAMKRTKQIMQIRKQDSYSRAIGGSFEDDHTGETKYVPEPAIKMRKQV